MQMFLFSVSNIPFAFHAHCFSGILALSNTSFGHFSSHSGHRFSSFGFLIPSYLSGIDPGGFEQNIGPALRVLHSFLKEADPHQYWDGLQKVVTEDGNILWLCLEHAHPYRVQPLQL